MNLAERRAFGPVEDTVHSAHCVPRTHTSGAPCVPQLLGASSTSTRRATTSSCLYRTSSIRFGVAGLRVILCVGDVENAHSTNVVSGHRRYQCVIGSILRELRRQDLDEDQVDRDEETLALFKDQDEPLEKSDLSDADAEHNARQLEQALKWTKECARQDLHTCE